MYKRIILSILALCGVSLHAQVDYIDLNLANGERISYPLSSVASVTFHTEALPGDGSEENPYTVAEALVAYQTQTSAQKVWVKGVIVGTVTGTYFSDATLGLENASASNILIATSRHETSTARCLPVQLPSGATRTALNLQTNPSNLYHEVTICATLDKYFGVAGLKSPSSYVLGPEATETTVGNATHPGRMEVPALIDGDEFITHTAFASDATTDRVPNFYVSYSPTQHHSHWVAFRFDATTRKKLTTRAESTGYPQDPDCASSLPTSAFRGTGYDHGHICASADRLFSSQANEQTFYMTNMSPQIPQFNQTYWNYYETYVQNYGRQESLCDTLYVVKGGTIGEGQTNTTLNCNGVKVPVPAHYFMALLKVKDHHYSAMAFWMEHREYDTVSNKNAELSAHAISIDELESHTGFDFFPMLPDDVERQVESTLNTSDWGL